MHRVSDNASVAGCRSKEQHKHSLETFVLFVKYLAKTVRET